MFALAVYPTAMQTLGIDEAGRGCVIGPLVIAGVIADNQDRRWFCRMNVRDSKIVPAPERDRLAQAIKERCRFELAIFWPAEIDAALNDPKRNLNTLECEGMANILKYLQEHLGDAPTTVLVDAPSINAQGFREQLFTAAHWNEPETFRARHHADKTSRTVGAASIIAKAERERLIEKIKREIGVNFGCGYAHDEKTRHFVATCPPDSPHVRWTWKTVQNVRCQTKDS